MTTVNDAAQMAYGSDKRLLLFTAGAVRSQRADRADQSCSVGKLKIPSALNFSNNNRHSWFFKRPFGRFHSNSSQIVRELGEAKAIEISDHFARINSISDGKRRWPQKTIGRSCCLELSVYRQTISGKVNDPTQQVGDSRSASTSLIVELINAATSRLTKLLSPCDEKPLLVSLGRVAVRTKAGIFLSLNQPCCARSIDNGC